jgi:hypothetical protein
LWSSPALAFLGVPTSRSVLRPIAAAAVFGADGDGRRSELRRAAVDGDGHEARAALLDDPPVGRGDAAGGHGGDRRADRGVPGEGEFLRRGEDAREVVGARIGGGEHEHGLGEAELLGDRLHLRGREVLAVVDDGELVARVRAVGEDVVDLERKRHGAFIARDAEKRPA